jgi:hypothetical protein
LLPVDDLVLLDVESMEKVLEGANLVDCIEFGFGIFCMLLSKSVYTQLTPKQFINTPI